MERFGGPLCIPKGRWNISFVLGNGQLVGGAVKTEGGGPGKGFGALLSA